MPQGAPEVTGALQSLGLRPIKSELLSQGRLAQVWMKFLFWNKSGGKTAEGMLVASPGCSEKSLDPAQPQEAGTRSQLLPRLHEGHDHSVPLGLTVSSLFRVSFPLPLSLLLFTCFLTNTAFYTLEFTVA